MELIKSIFENKFKEKLISNISSCFPNTTPVLEFYFENKFEPGYCNALITDDEVASSVQVLPQEIILAGHSFTAKYIYAAATSPNFRRKGYMKNLLDFTANNEKNKNTDFLFLVPCGKDIEKYYEKLGYENFFIIRKINFSQDEFKQFLVKNSCSDIKNFLEPSNNAKYVEKIRNMVYNNKNYVKYSEKDLNYAINLYNNFYGGKFVISGESFAICFFQNADVLKIEDFCAKNFEDSKKLLSIIYKEFPDCSEYHFNVCAENQFFKPYGNCEFYGMIKPLNSNAEQVMVALKKANEFPYLGIPLD